nr:MAG TPA: hypothetical protein [Caudoviricetes sp.]
MEFRKYTAFRFRESKRNKFLYSISCFWFLNFWGCCYC